jgi:hypothetical protein
VIRRLRCAALVAVVSAIAGCGGSHRPVTESTPAQSAVPTDTTPSDAGVAASSAVPIALPASSSGPTTCTVYDGYATQIIFRSEKLNVRTECLVWAANRIDVGYLWGYERAVAIPDALQVCALTAPHRDLTATVIEETGFAPVSAAERAKGTSDCENIVATGWRARRRARHATSPP